MEFTIKDAIEYGMNGILLFLLWQLWQAFMKLQDRVIDYLEQARIERHALRSQITAVQLQNDRAAEQRPPT